MDTNVSQEKAPRVPDKVKPITLTEHAFWEMLKEKAPGSYEKARDLCEKMREDPFIEVLPGVNGLRFRKTLQQSNQRVSLFFITTDSSIHVRLQAPRQQLESLGFDTKIVEKFGAKVKELLNGFSAPIEKVDTEPFRNALNDFISDLDEQEEK